jgi:uncharacterized protein YndB with AHSA1/START domain
MTTTATRPGVTSYTTPTDRELVVTRVVAAPRKLVFAAHTEPRHLQRWLLGPEGWTMPVCEFEARNGGAWRYVWRKADGSEMAMSGTVREILPPERVVHTERWGPEWPETINTTVFTESEGRTTITLTVTYPSREARDAALKTGMKDGMDLSYDRLDGLLRTLA